MSQLCRQNAMSHRFNTEKTSDECLKKFMKECGLVLTKPESTSFALFIAFNTVNGGKVPLRGQTAILNNIWRNLQCWWGGISTLATKIPQDHQPCWYPPSDYNFFSWKWDNGYIYDTWLHIWCGMSTTGNYTPPFFYISKGEDESQIFTRCQAQQQFSIYHYGWQSLTFFYYLNHFDSHARRSIQRPILLHMGNYASHITLEAIQFCKDNKNNHSWISFSQQPPL